MNFLQLYYKQEFYIRKLNTLKRSLELYVFLKFHYTLSHLRWDMVKSIYDFKISTTETHGKYTESFIWKYSNWYTLLVFSSILILIVCVIPCYSVVKFFLFNMNGQRPSLAQRASTGFSVLNYLGLKINLKFTKFVVPPCNHSKKLRPYRYGILSLNSPGYFQKGYS